jgi:hypothetical protein
MKVDRKTAEKSLKKKGFRRSRKDSHILFYHEYNGKETGIKTYFSHSKNYKDIGPDNMESMRRQLRLRTRKETEDLLNCPMTGEDYNGILHQTGVLNKDDPEV